MKKSTGAKQDKAFDKSMGGFLPKEKGEVDLIGKLFVRRIKESDEFGTVSLVCGFLLGLDWGKQTDDEMWEVEVNIKPKRRFIDDGPGRHFYGTTIDNVLSMDWDNPENYRELT